MVTWGNFGVRVYGGIIGEMQEFMEFKMASMIQIVLKKVKKKVCK